MTVTRDQLLSREVDPLPLLNAVMQARGYIVIKSTDPKEIGSVQEGFRLGPYPSKVRQKVVVIAETTREDLLEQRKLMGYDSSVPHNPAQYYYRAVCE